MIDVGLVPECAMEYCETPSRLKQAIQIVENVPVPAFVFECGLVLNVETRKTTYNIVIKI